MPESQSSTEKAARSPYHSLPCTICRARPGEPCVRYTDEFSDEPGARKGDPTPWLHYFGGRVLPPGMHESPAQSED